MEAHYNLLAAIQELQRQSPILSTIIHVKGHQDLGVTMVLSRLATMNIEMDEIAKHTVDMTKAQKGPSTIPEEPWSCAIKGRKLVKNIEKQLCKQINCLPLKGTGKQSKEAKQQKSSTGNQWDRQWRKASSPNKSGLLNM